MAIRRQAVPPLAAQSMANFGALGRQALASDVSFQQFMNSLPLDTANKFIGLLEAARNRRAQKSAASKARKRQLATQLGIAGGTAALTAGLGAVLAPGAAAGGAAAGAGAGAAAGGVGPAVANAPLALPAATGAAGAAAAPAALTAGEGALIGGLVGGISALAPQALGGYGVPQFVAPQTFGPFNPNQQPLFYPGQAFPSLTQTPQPVAPVKTPASKQIQSEPVTNESISVPEWSPGAIAPKPQTQRQITGEEPTPAAAITPKDIEQSAQNLRKIGQKALDEGDVDNALALARILAQIEERRQVA